jgi:endonuclease/exonuclease/phosphatase (EEP) superfamily protein YafD
MKLSFLFVTTYGCTRVICFAALRSTYHQQQVARRAYQRESHNDQWTVPGWIRSSIPLLQMEQPFSNSSMHKDIARKDDKDEDENVVVHEVEAVSSSASACADKSEAAAGNPQTVCQAVVSVAPSECTPNGEY